MTKTRDIISEGLDPETFNAMRALIASAEADGVAHVLTISAFPTPDGIAVSVVGNAHPNNILHFMIPELQRIVEKAEAEGVGGSPAA